MTRPFTLLLLFLGWLCPVYGQDTQPAADDIRQLSFTPGRTATETAVQIGRSLLGRPYVAHTLETPGPERLIVQFRLFDCTTFLETTLALALAWHELGDKKTHSAHDAAFRSYLTRLRYRNGRIDGYASRLHYFSDWLRDNERKGLLTDVTGDLGGMTVSKPVSYMTASPHKYPPLRDQATYRQIAQTEADLSRQSFRFIPKNQIRAIERNLREGDIIMLTAARPGLDMKHVGLVVWQNDRPHLLHASSEYGEVTITEQPLADYVLYNRRLSGIRVARLRPQGLLTVQAN